MKYLACHSAVAAIYNIPFPNLPGSRLYFFSAQLRSRRITLLFDWNTYQAELTKSIPDFAKLTPDSLKGYQTLSAANAKNLLLGEKVRQLISIAVAVTTRCDGCITFHTDAALKAGATKQEIAEALGVAMAMNAGAALIYSLRALDSVDAHAHMP